MLKIPGQQENKTTNLHIIFLGNESLSLGLKLPNDYEYLRIPLIPTGGKVEVNYG